MKRSTAFALILLGVMGILANAAGAPENPPATLPEMTPATAQDTAPPQADYKNIITVSGGIFNLTQRSQDVTLTGREILPTKNCLFWIFFCWYDGGGYVTTPLANSFDTRTHGVFSGSYERLFREHWGVGGVFTQMGNTYSVPAIGARGTVTTQHVFVRCRRYFGEPGGVRPFIGVGLGLVLADFDDRINTRGIGYGVEASAGFRYQMKHLSFSADLRGVASHVNFHKGEGTGSVYGSLNQGGTGAFVGLGYAF